MISFSYSRSAYVAKATDAYLQFLGSLSAVPEALFSESALFHSVMAQWFPEGVNAKAKSVYKDMAYDLHDTARVLQALRCLQDFSGDPDAYLSHIRGKAEVATNSFLRALWGLIVSGATDASSVIRHLDLLLARFEVSGRLYDSYDQAIRKGSGRYDYLENYLLLSSALLLLMQEGEINYRYLNTSLKLNDMFGYLMDNGIAVRPEPLLLGCFVIEKHLIEKVYGDEGYRMPAD
jgi:hypothetical protein